MKARHFTFHLLTGKFHALPRSQRQPQTLRDLPRHGPSSAGRDFTALPGESSFWQQVDHIAAHSSFPVETVHFIEDFFDLLWPAIEPDRGADERVHIFKIGIGAALVIRQNHCRVRPSIVKWELMNFPQLHTANFCGLRAAKRLDSDTSSES